MSERKSSAPAWSHPVSVADIPDTGRRVDIVADDAARAAIAKVAGVVALPRLEASFELLRQGSDRVRLVGRVAATVIQNCVVTLEPIESEIDEAVDLAFTAQGAAAAGAASLIAVDADDPPEPLHDGTVDLGAVATEFLLLGIDPYPRKTGAVFDAPSVGDPSSHPFAALAALHKADKPKNE